MNLYVINYTDRYNKTKTVIVAAHSVSYAILAIETDTTHGVRTINKSESLYVPDSNTPEYGSIMWEGGAKWQSP